MDAIITYLEHMFRGLPRTPDVLRARGELEQMSLDRYQELLAEGVSENEAVGRVITQFGNLDELADDLGIRAHLEGSAEADSVVYVSREEGEALIRNRGRMAWFIAGGLAVIMAGLSVNVLLSVNESGIARFGGGIFLVSVAIAVGLFVIGGMQGQEFKHFASLRIQLDEPYEREIQARKRSGQTAFVAMLVAGIMLIILGVAATATLEEFGVGDASAVWVFVGVALGVGLILQASMRRSALDRLLGQGDFSLVSEEQEKSNSMISRVAGPYWLLMVAAFLIWSFGWNAWHISWILWPVAGILFAFIATLIHSIRNTSDS
ncbi:permease prefix domain 1-containing protein [Gulosibacter sediminis]|uniref:permease prefix domain 1-containing protein n=1 Tax=Gulosibacter sediminis TaxID=1729695 RepID=UPI0024A8A4CF|nr:permease prefix domain 1-containing protein [Gulosibacter sediminis]